MRAGTRSILLSLAAAGMLQCGAASNEEPSDSSGAKAAERPAGSAPARANPAVPGDFRNVFSRVASEVVPWVVSVVPTYIDTLSAPGNPFLFHDDSPFEFFFGPPEGRRPPRGPPEAREFRQQSLGSGVIVSGDGYVLTNHHVVVGASEIEVRLHDGRVFEGRVLGSDSLSDVAVLKLDGNPDNLSMAPIGNSDSLNPGDWVLAVGNPFSLTSSVTAGIVSALDRAVGQAGGYQSFIQTDAAINPGNSGGALVNLDGRLVGINTMIFTRSGGYMGIGFAIPINMARRVQEALIRDGEVVRGWIGVSIQNLAPALREAMGIPFIQGALIADLQEGGPAALAGLRQGDVVIAIGEREVKDVDDLRLRVAELKPQSKVKFRVWREGKERNVEVAIGRRQPPGPAASRPLQSSPPGSPPQDLGIRVEALSPALRAQFRIPQEVQGVVVTEAEGGSLAAQALQPGDVIRSAKPSGGRARAIRNPNDWRRTVQGLRPGTAVALVVYRDGSDFYLSFKR